MKPWTKEILICILALTCMVGAIFFFYQSLHTEKTVDEVDLFNLVPENPRLVLDFNKNSVFTRVIEEKRVLQEISGKYIPEIYLSVMKALPEVERFLYSSHSRGDLLYAKLSTDQLMGLNDHLNRLFPGYPPQKNEKYGIRFMFYADVREGFWGYYYHKGIWVAGYSRKLLEEVAIKQLKDDFIQTANWQPSLEKLDRNALLNIALRTDGIELSFPVTDSMYYQCNEKWLGVEVFLGEENICFFGSLPADLDSDPVREIFVDTLLYQIDHWLFPLKFEADINNHDEAFYATFCSSLL